MVGIERRVFYQRSWYSNKFIPLHHQLRRRRANASHTTERHIHASEACSRAKAEGLHTVQNSQGQMQQELALRKLHRVESSLCLP